MADQCEHLADACAVLVDALLRACPGLRIIATSRHVLGVAGEVTVATVLVAGGLSNGQIAAALVISVRTVEKHVQHIMDKLGVSTRAQIAVWSAARPPAPPPPGSVAPGS